MTYRKRKLRQFGATILYVAVYELIALTYHIPYWTTPVAAVIIGITVAEVMG
jgi:hypothetical protein